MNKEVCLIGSFGADCGGLGFGPVAAASPNVMLAPPPPPDVILAPPPPPNGMLPPNYF